MHQREGSLLRGRVTRGLHLRGGGPALHPPRRVHRLRRVRAGVPGHGDLPGRGRTAAVEVVHREESGRVPGRQTAGEAVSGKGREVGARAPSSRVTFSPTSLARNSFTASLTASGRRNEDSDT